MIIMIKKKKHLELHITNTCCEEMLVCVVKHESMSFLQCYSRIPRGHWTGVLKE